MHIYIHSHGLRRLSKSHENLRSRTISQLLVVTVEDCKLIGRKKFPKLAYKGENTVSRNYFNSPVKCKVNQIFLM
jgi:hypothetical protein